MEPDQIAREEARMLHALVGAGARAAALDGRHLLLWGLIAALMLVAQYAAEVGDWLPSRLLWLWQPVALAGFAGSMFITRKGAGRRLGHPVARRYTIAFAAAGIGFCLYLLGAGAGDVPAALLTAMLLSATMGAAFCALAVTTHLRWMLAPAAGWWALLAYHAGQAALVPADWLRFAAAFVLLLALPGAILMMQRR